MNAELMQKIEEKVLVLLSELDGMRNEIIQLRKENAWLRDDQGTHAKKLESLIALLDSLEAPVQDSHLAYSTLECAVG